MQRSIRSSSLSLDKVHRRHALAHHLAEGPRRSAARRIQRSWRGYRRRKRERADEEARERDEAARRVQRCWRRKLERMNAQAEVRVRINTRDELEAATAKAAAEVVAARKERERLEEEAEAEIVRDRAR